MLKCHNVGNLMPWPKGALAIRRVFSLVDMITKTKFSNCLNVLTEGVSEVKYV